jgi:hypothetical protein
MTTSDSFDPVQSLPRFLAESAGHEPDGVPIEAVTRSPVLKAAILITAVAVVGVAALAVAHREALFADAPALLADTSPPQPAPATQVAAASVAPAADAQVSPPNTMDAPARNEMAASEPAKDPAESGDVLFKQFQAWAAEQDTQPKPVQERTAQSSPAPAPAAENVRTPNRFAQKRRYTRVVRNARAEIRAQNLRKQVRRPQASRAERPAVQDARAQEQPVQNGQPSPFVFGARN